MSMSVSNFTVVPSLPATSFSEISALAEALRGEVNELQIDIVDGRFVDAVSWPFTETEPIEALRQLPEVTEGFSIEMDCMVQEPRQYLDIFVELAVNRVIVHMQSTQAYEEIITHARTHGYKIGIAFTNDVPSDAYVPLIPKVDFVQVMGIAVVGKQGQPFDTRTLDTVRHLKMVYPDLEIAVDGSVNLQTITQLRDAGTTRFAPGSAIAKQEDPLLAYHQLVTALV